MFWSYVNFQTCKLNASEAVRSKNDNLLEMCVLIRVPVGRSLVPRHTRVPRYACENSRASSRALTADVTNTLTVPRKAAAS